jgi:hypothetical protein
MAVEHGLAYVCVCVYLQEEARKAEQKQQQAQRANIISCLTGWLLCVRVWLQDMEARKAEQKQQRPQVVTLYRFSQGGFSACMHARRTWRRDKLSIPSRHCVS